MRRVSSIPARRRPCNGDGKPTAVDLFSGCGGLTVGLKNAGFRLLVIPREVMGRRAVQAGDVHFYELAYLKASLHQERRTVTVRLEDFIIPNPDLVPDEVRSKIKKWSDYIDFWAVNWEFHSDTFHNQWQTYRTRKSPTLRLLSDPHTYDQAGSYKLLVKVIDIFGNDTTKLLEVMV